MNNKNLQMSIVGISLATAFFGGGIAWAQTYAAAAPNTTVPPASSPISLNVYERNRTDAYNWYADPPYTNTYPFVEQLLRVSVAQQIRRVDWLVELASNDSFDLPTTAVSPVAAQGALGLGGNYYAANANSTPAAVALRQGYIRYRGVGPDTSVRLGRFEFFDGLETHPKNSTLAWLQDNRVAQRLIGNFGFSTGQRSFDGIDGHYGKGSWDVTAMAGRATQGVFNMNANPEINVDVQYLAYSNYQFREHMLWRVFAVDYHDGRTGITKTDNRPLAVRQADHKNIRVGTYGADMLATTHAGPGEFDVVLWGVLQNGNWGALTQHAGAFAAEAGYRLTSLASKPWLRGGYFRSTGDNHPADTVHNTFFQILPTARAYARFPFYNLMNSKDEFAEIVYTPGKKLTLRSDIHFLQLTASSDLWYQGGGAYDNLVFGYAGRPAGGSNSLATVVDISSDYQLTRTLALNLYYAHADGKSIVAADYPAGSAANFGYLELLYRWSARSSRHGF
jgi:hypothetical protein